MNSELFAEYTAYLINNNKAPKHVKQAAVGGDLVREFGGNLGATYLTKNPNIPVLSFLGGHLHGLASKTPTLEEVQELDTNPGRAWMPGVGTSRAIRRRRALRKLLHDRPEWLDLPVSELSGMATSVVAPSAIGNAVGGETGSDVGATIGFGGAGLGSLAALFTKRRSLEEQAKVENSTGRAILRHIVPGLATYDFWKGLGATRNLSEDSPEMLRAKIKDIRAKRNGSTAPHEMEQMALDALDDYMESKGATRLL